MSKRIIWLGSLISGFIMIIITYWWLSMAYTFGDEAFVMKWSLLIKKSLLQIDPKPLPEELLFVDISTSKTTLETESTFGVKSDLHRQIIVDRAHLARFFEIIAPYKDHINFVICDILFERPTPYDSLLTESIKPFKNKLLGVSHLSDGQQLIEPVIDIPHAVATYNTTLGLFLKYPLLLDNTYITLPLKWLQTKDNREYRTTGRFHFIDDKLSLPAPVIDFKIRSSDFEINDQLTENNYTIHPLGDLIEFQDFLDEEDFIKLFENKTILIGDYQDDMHQTPYGKIAGPIILLNSYLSLKNSENIIRWPWVLFIYLSYVFMSMSILADVKVNHPVWLKSIFKSKIGLFILNSLDEIFYLVLLTFLSYLFFNKHINILILFIYLKALEMLWKALKKNDKQATLST